MYVLVLWPQVNDSRYVFDFAACLFHCDNTFGGMAPCIECVHKTIARYLFVFLCPRHKDGSAMTAEELAQDKQRLEGALEKLMETNHVAKMWLSELSKGRAAA